MRCRVFNCKSTNENKASKLSFFCFPLDDEVARKWVEFCRQDKPFNMVTSVVCMRHFRDEDIANLLQYNMGYAKSRLLKRGAVPTIYTCDETTCESRNEGGTITNHIRRGESQNDPLALPSALYSDNLQDLEFIDSTSAAKPKSRDKKGGKKLTELSDHNGVNDYQWGTAAIPTTGVFYSDMGVKEEGVLKREVKSLKLKNASLENQIKKQQAELTLLQRRSIQQKKRYMQKIQSLQNEIKSMAEQVKNMENKLASLFTQGQIEQLKRGCIIQKWTDQDVAQSITLYATSPKAYRVMCKLNFPLPPIRTLKSWTRKFDITEGLMEPVFLLMAAATHMNAVQKICVLSFGETKASQFYSHNESTTQSSTNYVQIAMLRGLFSNWNQPIFFDVSRKMSSELLQKMLLKSHICGYTVVAIVRDLEESNTTLFSEFNIKEDQPWFLLNGEQVFVFPDIPCLLKSLLSQFLNEGFLINEKPVEKKIISALFSSASKDTRISIAHKITESQLSVNAPERHKIKTAVNLFSNTVAEAIEKAASLGHLKDFNWCECAELLKITNDWFEVLNVKEPQTHPKQSCHAYGLAHEAQDKILDAMNGLMCSMRVVGTTNLQSFQKDIIQTNKALKLLYENLQKRFGVKYILTNRLNRDPLENLFGIIRYKGHLQEIKFRLRLYLLGYSKDTITDCDIVEGVEDNTMPDIQPPLTGILLKNLSSASNLLVYEEGEEFEEVAEENIHHKLNEDMANNSLIACNIDDVSHSYAVELSDDVLIVPNSTTVMEIDI